MTKAVAIGAVSLALTACAQSRVEVSAPYTRDDGNIYQDVTTVAASGTGIAPVVTNVDTYKLIEDEKAGGADCGCLYEPVASASGVALPMWQVILENMGIGVAAALVRETLDDESAQQGAVGGGVPISDRRMKRDIVALGSLENGTNLYAFRYVSTPQFPRLDTETLFVGVMAQEVAETHPEAVVAMPGGLLGVRYDLLGFNMVTYDEWQLSTLLKE